MIHSAEASHGPQAGPLVICSVPLLATLPPARVPCLRCTGCCCQGGVVDQRQFISFVRQRGLAVIATRGADGAPQAALIGITATERGELVFDTSRSLGVSQPVRLC